MNQGTEGTAKAAEEVLSEHSPNYKKYLDRDYGTPYNVHVNGFEAIAAMKAYASGVERLKERLGNQEDTISGFQNGLTEMFELEKPGLSFFNDFKRLYNKKFKSAAAQPPAAGVWEGKYSWEKIEDQYQVRHKEGKEDTFIAKTDSAEKAHFLAHAANFLSSVEYGSGQEQGQAAEVEKWKDEYGAMEKIISDYQVTDRILRGKIEAAKEIIFPYWKKEHANIPSYRIIDEWELFKSENNL